MSIRRTFWLTMSINVYFLVVNDTYFVLTKHLFSISNFTIVLFHCFIVVVVMVAIVVKECFNGRWIQKGSVGCLARSVEFVDMADSSF